MDANIIYKVVSAYYRDSLNQEQISCRFGISRIKVSRLLRKARAEGLVQISIKPPPDSRTGIEQELAEVWGLDEIILAENRDSGKKLLESVGYETWKYFRRILRDGQIVGLSWGTALSAFADAVEPSDLTGVRVVQLVGGLGSPEADTHGTGLVLRVAARLNGIGRILSAPGIVENESVREALYSDSEISETLRLGAAADIAVVGIGGLSGNLLPENDRRLLEESGAVGDIAFQFFSVEGYKLNENISRRIVGAEWEQLKKIPRVIGTVSGKNKHRSVAAALKTGLLNVLVTDEETGDYLHETALKEGLL